MNLYRTFILICFFLFANISAVFTQTISEELKENANAIIIEELTKVTHLKYNRYSLEEKVKVLILNKKAEHFQSINLGYSKGSEKLADIKITVYDSNNKVLKKVKSKEIDDQATFNGFSIVTDSRVKSWKYNTTKYPIIIEYSYKKESKNTSVLPSWIPIPTYNTSVLSSKYILDSSLPIREQQLNFEKYSTIKTTDDGFVMQNQKALKAEKFSPESHNIFPLVYQQPVRFSYEGNDGEYTDWNGYALWMYNSFLGTKLNAFPNELVSEIDKEIDLEAEKREIAKKLYEIIQDNMRYVSISLKDGGLNPMDPQKVHEVEYGDCKALSLYYSSLLKQYDIPSSYILVHANTSNTTDLIEDYPGRIPGNHAITMIPLDKDTLWADCTSSTNPFNFLGSFTDDRLALAVSEKGGTIVKTPKYSAELNQSIEFIEMNFNDSGIVNVSFSNTKKGLALSNIMTFEKMQLKEFKDYFKNSNFSDNNGINPSNFEVSINKDSLRGAISFDFELKDYVEKAGDYIFIPLSVSTLNIPKLPKDGQRDHPIEFVRDFNESIELKLKTKDSFELLEYKEIYYTSEYGVYSQKVEKENDSSFIVKRSFTLYKKQYPPSEYKKLKSFLDKCLKSEYTTLNLKKI